MAEKSYAYNTTALRNLCVFA